MTHIVRRCSAIVTVALATSLGSCAWLEGDVYTLYRASPIDSAIRIHVASFDSSDGDAYNRENCDVTRALFQAQPGVTVRYWCEKGRYRK